MADFIVINANKIESIAKINVLKSHNIESKGLGETVENDMGDFPVYGSISALMIAYPELAAQKYKLYETFSRKKASTFYDQNSNILVCKSFRVTAKRNKLEEAPEEIESELIQVKEATAKTAKPKKQVIAEKIEDKEFELVKLRKRLAELLESFNYKNRTALRIAQTDRPTEEIAKLVLKGMSDKDATKANNVARAIQRKISEINVLKGK